MHSFHYHTFFLTQKRIKSFCAIGVLAWIGLSLALLGVGLGRTHARSCCAASRRFGNPPSPKSSPAQPQPTPPVCPRSTVDWTFESAVGRRGGPGSPGPSVSSQAPVCVMGHVRRIMAGRGCAAARPQAGRAALNKAVHKKAPFLCNTCVSIPTPVQSARMGGIAPCFSVVVGLSLPFDSIQTIIEGLLKKTTRRRKRGRASTRVESCSSPIGTVMLWRQKTWESQARGRGARVCTASRPQRHSTPPVKGVCDRRGRSFLTSCPTPQAGATLPFLPPA